MSLPTFQRSVLPPPSGWWDIHHPNDGGSTDLWNVSKLIPVYTALKPRRQPSSQSLLWEPQVIFFSCVGLLKGLQMLTVGCSSHCICFLFGCNVCIINPFLSFFWVVAFFMYVWSFSSVFVKVSHSWKNGFKRDISSTNFQGFFFTAAFILTVFLLYSALCHWSLKVNHLLLQFTPI
jgi:hypothetical protein